jgi:hypothetical protein
MAEPLRNERPMTVVEIPPPPSPKAKERGGAYVGYRILQVCFVILPIVVGTDKFFHVLVNWDMYLSPQARVILGTHAHAMMKAAGAAEILIGIGMIFRPGIFSYIISAWLMGIVVNLLLTGAFFDVALRDFALVLATFALGKMSESFSKK